MEHFKSIPELIQSLNQLALRINKGSVGLEEFETTLRDARELYERLVILRYKAIEDRNLMGGSTGGGNEKPAGDTDQEPNLAARQISLIDSIEEIARETTGPAAAETARNEVEPPPMKVAPAQTRLDMESAREEPKEEPKKDVPAEKQATQPPAHSDVIPPIAQEPTESDARPDSLAEKLSQTRIDDLTVAIGLNQKFQFIKELFEGDADAYTEAVKKLNRADNKQAAMDYLRNEVKEPFGWDEEDETTLAFINLIERRFA